jgi:hypothetical protein
MSLKRIDPIRQNSNVFREFLNVSIAGFTDKLEDEGNFKMESP